MIHYAARIIFSVLLGGGSFVATAQEEANAFNPLGRNVPVEELEKLIRIQLEWIELDHERLTELLADQGTMRVDGHLSSDAAPLRAAVAELIEADEAILLETAILTARSGQRAKVESIREYIYPTEYDPPGALLSNEAESGGRRAGLSYLPQATAFETRNLGVTVEVDPVLGADDRTIDLNLAPEIVYLADEESWGTHREGGSEVEIRMPIIYTMKMTTQVAVVAGEYFFLGAQSPLNEETRRVDTERRVMMFLKIDLLHVGLPLDE